MKAWLAWLAFAGVCMFAAALVWTQPACTNPPQLPPSVSAAGRCIIDTISLDLLAHMTWEEAAADAALRCLGKASPENIAEITSLWQAHKAAELREMDAGADR